MPYQPSPPPSPSEPTCPSAYHAQKAAPFNAVPLLMLCNIGSSKVMISISHSALCTHKSLHALAQSDLAELQEAKQPSTSSCHVFYCCNLLHAHTHMHLHMPTSCYSYVPAVLQIQHHASMQVCTHTHTHAHASAPTMHTIMLGHRTYVSHTWVLEVRVGACISGRLSAQEGDLGWGLGGRTASRGECQGEALRGEGAGEGAGVGWHREHRHTVCTAWYTSV